MALKRILTAFLTVVLTGGAGFAQSMSAGNVSVKSDPPGALASLEGEAVVAGVTPARFQYNLVGDYRLVVKLDGYETYRTHVSLDPSRPSEFIVTLSPRTKLKAALRSTVIPGWGQWYSGQKTKGTALMLLTIGTSVAALIADNRFDDKYDIYETKLAEYDAATSYDELVRLQPGLAEAQRKAYDAENVRRACIGLMAGVWAFNVLDNFLFFPHHPTGFRVKGLTFAPTADFGQVGLTLGTSF